MQKIKIKSYYSSVKLFLQQFSKIISDV